VAADETANKRLKSDPTSRLPIETRFKPGNQASKGVRHGKGAGVLTELKKLLRREFPGDPQKRKGKEVLAASLLVNAIKGNGTAIKQLLDRLEGAIPVSFDEETGTLKVQVEYVGKNGHDPTATPTLDPGGGEG